MKSELILTYGGKDLMSRMVAIFFLFVFGCETLPKQDFSRSPAGFDVKDLQGTWVRRDSKNEPKKCIELPRGRSMRESVVFEEKQTYKRTQVFLKGKCEVEKGVELWVDYGDFSLVGEESNRFLILSRKKRFRIISSEIEHYEDDRFQSISCDDKVMGEWDFSGSEVKCYLREKEFKSKLRFSEQNQYQFTATPEGEGESEALFFERLNQ